MVLVKRLLGGSKLGPVYNTSLGKPEYVRLSVCGAAMIFLNIVLDSVI
jgi:hypothetical protein